MFFFAKIFRKLYLPDSFNRFFNNYRHSRITSYLVDNYSEVINKYSELNKMEQKEIFPNIIWVFWWQGLENAPLLAKACINSIIDNSGSYEVVLVTEDTIKKYTDIPEFIYEKFEEGKISVTHFSDILRFNLLKNYGGIWMDATLFVKRELPTDYTSFSLFTNTGFADREFFNIANGRWTGFMIGGIKNHALFRFMNEMFIYYWEHEDALIDYFLIDYLLDIAYKNNIGSFRDYIDQNSNYNPSIFDLEKKLNVTMSENVFNELFQDTSCFKLNFKKKYYSQKKDVKTVYGHIVGRGQ